MGNAGRFQGSGFQASQEMTQTTQEITQTTQEITQTTQEITQTTQEITQTTQEITQKTRVLSRTRILSRGLVPFADLQFRHQALQQALVTTGFRPRPLSDRARGQP